jgi:hypothetical protein
MNIRIGLLSAVSILGLIAAVHAQTGSQTAGGPAFDGTYHVVSSTKANDTHRAYNGQVAHCLDRRPSQLHIVHGQAHYTTATGYRLRGTVGPQDELAMRSETIGGSRPFEMDASGSVDANGTVHVHQRGSSCSYDFVWQK